MALTNNITMTAAGTSLSVVHGKWTMRVAEGTPGAAPRQLTKGKNEGQTVWEIGYSSVSGHIVHGALVESDLVGLTAELTLKDHKNNEEYKISLSADNRMLKDLIKRLPNIDSTKEVKLEIVKHPTKKTKTGGDVFNLHIIQDGRMIPDFYTKWSKVNGENKVERLHGLPDGVKTRTGWDFRAQDEFLLEKFEEFFAAIEPVDDPNWMPEDDDRVPLEVEAQSEGLVPEDQVDSDNIQF